MEPTLNPNDVAYMSLLTRNIPGVGDAPLDPNASTTSAPLEQVTHRTHISNRHHKNHKDDLTEKQRQALKILEHAQKDALFVSEGEEPFQTVHIIPEHLDAATATLRSDSVANVPTKPLPADRELLKLLKDSQLIPEDEVAGATCERTLDLHVIVNKSNPGADKIAKALQDLFHYDPASSSSSLHENNTSVALYRVTLPSSETEVHIWVLGWVDCHLLGFHTISIES